MKGVEPAEPVEPIRRKRRLSASEPQPCERCSTQTVGATLGAWVSILAGLDKSGICLPN